MAYTGGGIIAAFKIKYQGADVLDYKNDHKNVAKDQVIAELLPKKICPCAVARATSAVCVREGTVMKIAHSMLKGHDSGVEETMRALMRATQCSDEACVIDHAQRERILTAAEAGIEKQIAFKQNGPTDGSLFNDSVIQAQLYAWMYQFPRFWAYNFNMLDWETNSLRAGHVVREPDTLATVDCADLYKGQIPVPVGMKMTEAAQVMLAEKRKVGIRCAACIVNSDHYSGSGKHWMALFADMRDESDAPHWTVEFFNSAAVAPESEWLVWVAKTKKSLQELNPKATIDAVNVCKVWHQHSKTECGPYSMFYVWARLRGVAPKYFLENVVPDQIMFEFRQHLFKTGSASEEFDFEKFATGARVKWDQEFAAKKKV